jgi:hypothetical protein
MLRGVVGASLVLAVLCAAAVADDGVVLQVSHSPAPGEVRLDWSGGQPVYLVYRSTNPASVVTPANKLGESFGGPWLDSPPAGSIFYYRIVGPCQTPSTERCDGVDDDCDGLIDNGCPGSCTADAGCAPGEYCDATGLCAPDLDDGQACGRDEQCVANHCSNDVCCGSGDCCTSPGQCTAHGWAPRCDDGPTCQGSKGTPSCSASFQCGVITEGDDSPCAGQVSQACGPYPSIFCTNAVTQPPDQSALCPGSCTNDLGCDTTAYCDAANHCLPDGGPGVACAGTSQCQSAICTDGVCCNTTCTGGCEACDLGASSGTCTLVPDGADPDSECGSVSCIGYYSGWSGDSCRRKADLSPAATTCDGAGACRAAAQECTAQTLPGPITTTCNATCQDPNLATCTGTTAGVCTNVNPGNQTCGNGACQVTVPQCSNGAPVTCVPNSGAATTETCNNLDDNCDGTIDNGAFSDSREPNNSCVAYTSLPTVGSDQTLTQNTLTIYPSGDVDTFRINATETDSTCGCGAFGFDEDYRLTVTLTVPPGAGSYQFCTSAACASLGDTCQTINAGSSSFWTWDLDGDCSQTSDSYSIYFRIAPWNSPGFECLPYTLSYFFDAGLCQ